MTKAEYIAQYGQSASKQAASPEFKALQDTAREECPFLAKNLSDPTSIVRNEGAVQGWFAAIAFMKTAHEPVKKPEERAGPAPQYPDPSNLNPKKP